MPSSESCKEKYIRSQNASSKLSSDVEKQDSNCLDNGVQDRTAASGTSAWQPGDPENPMNWPKSKKNGVIAAVCFMRFVGPLGTSMMAPALSQIADEFGETSKLLLTCTVSIYVIGFGIGPLLMAPLSEVYGRNIAYHISNVLFTIFTVCCGLCSNTASLIIFRLLAGLMGSVPLTNGGGTISDIVPVEERGLIMSITSLTMIIGPVAGPIGGGFLAGAAGWRWVFWLLTIVSGLMTLSGFLFLHETYLPVLLAKRHPSTHKKASFLQVLTSFIQRPLKLFYSDPITPIASAYICVIYGIIQLLFTTFALVFQDTYGFEEGTAGLAYLGIGIGSAIGLFLNGRYSDLLIKMYSRKKGQTSPEARLLLILPCGPVFAIGIFLYGWSAQYRVHWIVPIIGSGIAGVASALSQSSIQTFIIDVYPRYAASALAANTLLRCLAGGLVPLGGLQMYDTIGLGWGNSLLGFLAILVSLGPVALWVYGEGWRGRFVRGGIE